LRNDIKSFVTAEVSKLFSGNMRDEIRSTLLNGSNGMFLWVSLILEELKNSKTIKPSAIREKLMSLPTSLPNIYNKILGKIGPEDRSTASTILQWIVGAVRPLTTTELTIAIAI
jgi:hypothetical protein